MKQLYIISILVFVFYSLLISNNIRKNNNEHFDYIDFDMVLDKKCESINSLNEHYDWKNRKMRYQRKCIEKKCNKEFCFKMDLDTCSDDCASSLECKEKHKCCPNGEINESEKILDDGKCISKDCTVTQLSDENGVKNYMYIGCEDSIPNSEHLQLADFMELYLPRQNFNQGGAEGQNDQEQPNFYYDEYKYTDEDEGSIVYTPTAGSVFGNLYSCTISDTDCERHQDCTYDDANPYSNENEYMDIYAKECRKCPKNHYVLYAEGHQSKACCNPNKCFGLSTMCYDKDTCKKRYKTKRLNEKTCECEIPTNCETNDDDFNVKCSTFKKLVKPICDKQTELSCYVSDAQTFIKYKNNDECNLEPVDDKHKSLYQTINSIFDCKRTCPLDTRYMRSTNKCTCKDRRKRLNNNDDCVIIEE
jgi:hypothetical protein